MSQAVGSNPRANAPAAQQGLAAATSQPGVPGSGSLLASNLHGFGEAGQRWLVQLKPDPFVRQRGWEAVVSQRELASVAFVALGVFIAASRIPDLFFCLAVLFQSPPAVSSPASQPLLSIVVLIGSLVAIGLGLILVAWRDRLAARLFPGTSELNVGGSHAVALSVLGCFFAIRGVSRALGAGGVDWSALTEAALGICLFFGARGVVGVWTAARSAGKPEGSSKRAV